MSDYAGKVVCVTGASGFIVLLLRGYIVKATVRDPSDPIKVDHLLKLDGAKERLHLIKANLMEEGSFDPVIEGCEGVFHTASPFSRDPKDPQHWYVLSKTLAEDAAWEFVKEKKIDLVAINPGMVIGPLLQPTLNDSAAIIFNLINGAQTFPNFTLGWINVKDVANAHIQAFEISSASGRYCLVQRVEHYEDIINILHKLYPTLQLPQKCEDDKPLHAEVSCFKREGKKLGS